MPKHTEVLLMTAIDVSEWTHLIALAQNANFGFSLIKEPVQGGTWFNLEPSSPNNDPNKSRVLSFFINDADKSCNKFRSSPEAFRAFIDTLARQAPPAGLLVQSLKALLQNTLFEACFSLHMLPKFLHSEIYVRNEASLEKLKKAFSSPLPAHQIGPSQIVLLRGIPGIGKTALSLSYAREEEGALWFHAKNCLTLLAEYRQFIHSHGQIYDPKRPSSQYLCNKPSEILASMRAWFVAHPDRLVVYDGITSYDDELKGAILTVGKGRLLLTSAYGPPINWFKEFNISTMWMDRMSEQDALLLLQALLPEVSGHLEALNIIKQMDFLPAALIKYALFYKSTQEDRLKNKPVLFDKIQDFLTFSPMPAGFFPHPALGEGLKRYLQHFHHVQTRSGGAYAKFLLRFCAHLPQEKIPYLLLDIWRKYSFGQPSRLLRLLEKLHNFQIINWDKHDIVMSPLLKAVVLQEAITKENKARELYRVYRSVQEGIPVLSEAFLSQSIDLLKSYPESHSWGEALEQELREKSSLARNRPALFIIFWDLGAAFTNIIKENNKALSDPNSLKHMADLIALIEKQGRQAGIVICSASEIEASVCELIKRFQASASVAQHIIGKSPTRLPQGPLLDSAQIRLWLESQTKRQKTTRDFLIISQAPNPLLGRSIYASHVVECQGTFGSEGFNKAKNLLSALSDKKPAPRPGLDRFYFSMGCPVDSQTRFFRPELGPEFKSDPAHSVRELASFSLSLSAEE